MIEIKIAEMLIRYKLPIDSATPKNKNGVTKQLGIWDYEGTYKRFKTLGAKRYMVDEDGHINITVSGLNKSVCVPYLFRLSENPFTIFNDDLYVPGEYTGKKTHTYIDEIREGDITDYLGNTAHYHELSGVHLEYSTYAISDKPIEKIKDMMQYLIENQIIRGSGYE